MAKAGVGAKPKLSFREHGEAKSEISTAGIHAEKQVETEWTHINQCQSFKTVFLGDSGVGKTCLAKLYVDRQVVTSATSTIGFDHLVKDVLLENGLPVKLQIWDTAGMEQFRNALVTKYYRNTHGIVLVYDITKLESFENLENWIAEVKKYCGLETVQMALIGNKLDQEKDRKVSVETAQVFADSYGMTFVELSAKSLENLSQLEKLFVTLAERMFTERERLEMTTSGVIRLEESYSEDWEIVEAPEEPIPRRTYAHQDSRARRSRAFNDISKSCRC